MRSFALLCAALAAGAASLMLAAPAQAQATRTWVSGVGDDVNPCSRTAPCKTFAGAISKTAAGGEINCLDPGGFGAVTIIKSMAIVCDYTEGGALAGGNGIVVNLPASTDKVYLSGLDIKGVNPPNTGIRMVGQGTLIVNNVSVRDFINGIEVVPASGIIEVSIIDTIVANNTTTGVLIRPTGSGTVRMTVTNSKFINNTGDGLIANTTAPTTGTVHVSIRDSLAAHNGANGFVAFSAAAGGALAQLMIDESAVMNNGTNGLAANGSGSSIRFARTNVTRNGTGVVQTNSGSVLSYTAASNTVDQNGVDGTFGTTPFK